MIIMKRTALTLALVLVTAATALAQVPRTINYQGRVNNGTSGLTGQHQMTLKIWSAATGGTVLFTEVQQVTFSNGVFTVAIGGITAGGISPSVTFDRQLWLGVTIDGVNGNQELTPRFILRSSPYSFRSIIADSSANAGNAAHAADAAQAAEATHAKAADSSAIADTAHTLRVPALIAAAKGKPTLVVKGSPVAIVSDGVDSVTKYVVVGDTAGASSKPVAGATYRDNVAIAWAEVNRDGSMVSDFGIDSVVYTASIAGYKVYLSHPMEMAGTSDAATPKVAPVITIGGGSADIGSQDANPAYVVWSLFRAQAGGGFDPSIIIVRVYALASLNNGNPTQRPFSITVFGRPQ